MCFICAVCGKPAPHKVSPYLDTETREKVYFSDNVQVGVGSEIVVEHKICPSCSHRPVKAEQPIDNSALKTFANGFARKHARGCEGVVKVRKNGESRTIPCTVCERIVETFRTIPAHLLSEILSDTPATPVKVSLGALFLDGLEKQSNRTTGRASRDFATSYGVLKSYESRGGGI